MQRYYRTVMDVSLLNEMLLQLFREAILTPSGDPVPLNARFQTRNDYLEVTADDVFARSPSALLELFGLIQQNPHIRGVRAATIRLVGRSLWLIDEEFRQNPRHHRLFLDILRAPIGVTHALRRMNLYGVLGTLHSRVRPRRGPHAVRPVPCLHGRCAYAVRRQQPAPPGDAEVRPGIPDAEPHCAVAAPKLEIAYLAALFHDIAKGRGGDHSELGAVDAEAFCLEQGLSRYDARLVAWLVRNHLLLSVTAQKKDIADPEVIREFARVVGDQTHLDYLYVLTVADVRGTNPKLWNTWKASLFEEFYERTKRALRRGLESPIDQDELVRETQAAARTLLAQRGADPHAVERVWQLVHRYVFPASYAGRDRLAHGAPGGARAAGRSPLVAVNPLIERGGTPIFTYTPHRQHSFARTTAVLDQMGLNIVNARVTPTSDGYSIESYLVLEDNGRTISDPARIQEIERALLRSLSQPAHSPPAVTRRAPRQVRMFATPTQVVLTRDERNNRTILELIASDRPGLLSEVGKVFMGERVDIHGARIMTVGERAEDVFYVSHEDGRPLTDEAGARLQQKLVETLDRRE